MPVDIDVRSIDSRQERLSPVKRILGSFEYCALSDCVGPLGRRADKRTARRELNMTDRMQYDDSDPRHHTLRLKQMLNDTATHAREDIRAVAKKSS
jgi:hypothetical protein